MISPQRRYKCAKESSLNQFEEKRLLKECGRLLRIPAERIRNLMLTKSDSKTVISKRKKIAIIWKSRMNSRNTAVRKYIILKPPKLWDCNYYKKKFSCRPYHKTNIYFSLHVIGWHWKKGAYIHGEKTKCELLGYHQRWYHRKLLAWYSYDVAFVCCLISLLR